VRQQPPFERQALIHQSGKHPRLLGENLVLKKYPSPA
jgi:hypothetical protein